jgi:hypothetical protein
MTITARDTIRKYQNSHTFVHARSNLTKYLANKKYTKLCIYVENLPDKPGSVRLLAKTISLCGGVWGHLLRTLMTQAQPTLQASTVYRRIVSPRPVGALTTHFHPYLCLAAIGGVLSVATFSRLAPGWISQLLFLTPARTFLWYCYQRSSWQVFNMGIIAGLITSVPWIPMSH